MPQYQGKPVTVVRDAKQGDADFNPAPGQAQVLIRLADGSEKTVPRAEVTNP